MEPRPRAMIVAPNRCEASPAPSVAARRRRRTTGAESGRAARRESRFRRRSPAPAAPRRCARCMRKPADLAMVDLRMPDVNGLDLLRQIRVDVPGLRSDPDDRVRRGRQRGRSDQARRARVPHQAVRLRAAAAGAGRHPRWSSSAARRSSRSRARWRGSSSSAGCSGAAR